MAPHNKIQQKTRNLGLADREAMVEDDALVGARLVVLVGFAAGLLDIFAIARKPDSLNEAHPRG